MHRIHEISVDRLHHYLCTRIKGPCKLSIGLIFIIGVRSRYIPALAVFIHRVLSVAYVGIRAWVVWSGEYSGLLYTGICAELHAGQDERPYYDSNVRENWWDDRMRGYPKVAVGRTITYDDVTA